MYDTAMEEQDMEMEVDQVFVAYEIDIDYEFDAARFFDFTRPETPAQARLAELWFQTAPTYPPSPFVTKFVMREEIVPENINSPTAMEDNKYNASLLQKFSANNDDDEGSKTTGRGLFTSSQRAILLSESKQLQFATGLSVVVVNGKQKAHCRCAAKSLLARSSTLMKPTASQLAKQNWAPRVTAFRFQKLMVGNDERCLNNVSVVESQAVKRQKMDHGLLHKVFGTKPQTEFVHKAPKKEGITAKASEYSKPITIPREPDLETAHRAQRIRPKTNAGPDLGTLPTRKFKARPLNRKILNAPSLPLPKKSIPRLPEFQEFHLKTQERAMHHATAATSSSHHPSEANKCLDKSVTFVTESGIRDSRRPITTFTSRHERLNSMHNFKARPLNKKIFSSKGDIGIFRNIKQETTVPVEFKFNTDKKVQHNPPVDLFSKLSLTSDLHSKDGFCSKPLRWTGTAVKGLKENRLNCFHPQREMPNLVEEKSSSFFATKQTQVLDDGFEAGADSRMSSRRSLALGIR